MLQWLGQTEEELGMRSSWGRAWCLHERKLRAKGKSQHTSFQCSPGWGILYTQSSGPFCCLIMASHLFTYRHFFKSLKDFWSEKSLWRKLYISAVDLQKFPKSDILLRPILQDLSWRLLWTWRLSGILNSRNANNKGRNESTLIAAHHSMTSPTL